MREGLDMKKTIEIDIDEVTKVEITSLRKKVTNLERQVVRLKDKNYRIEELLEFSKDNRSEILSAADHLVTLLRDLSWTDYDNYYDSL